LVQTTSMVILYLNTTKGTKKMPEQEKEQPFHQSILRMIESARFSINGRDILGHMIILTEITSGHDAIIAKWKSSFRGGFPEVVTALERKKDMTEEEATKASAEDKLWVITGAIEQHGQESLGSPSTKKNDKLYDRVRMIHRAETKDELQAVIAKL